jgi:hypothetical protein
VDPAARPAILQLDRGTVAMDEGQGSRRAATPLPLSATSSSAVVDPRHRQILESLDALNDERHAPANDVDVAVRLGLRDPAAMGSLLDETVALGWAAVTNKIFAGAPLDYVITDEGRAELRAAKERPAPPVTLDDIKPEVRQILRRWTIDQPLYPHQLAELLRIDGLTESDAARLLRQMTARVMVEPYMDGWYPT